MTSTYITLATLIIFLNPTSRATGLNEEISKKSYIERDRTTLEQTMCSASAIQNCPGLSADECQHYMTANFDACVKSNSDGIPETVNLASQEIAKVAMIRLNNCAIKNYFEALTKAGKKCKSKSK